MHEELWERLGHSESIFEGANWPEYDETKAAVSAVQIAVQVNRDPQQPRRGRVEDVSQFRRVTRTAKGAEVAIFGRELHAS